MFKRISFLLAVSLLPALASVAHAQAYKVDPVHSTTVFRIHHMNAGYIWGFITEPTGTFSYDAADPSKISFHIKAALDHLYTGNTQRDTDLKGQDWFNAKQFPELSFDSDSVKKTGDNAYAITGNLTIHGVTKAISTTIEMTGQGKGMNGEDRRGFEATFTINRNDYDIKALPGAVGDEVKIVVALEGVPG